MSIRVRFSESIFLNLNAKRAHWMILHQFAKWLFWVRTYTYFFYIMQRNPWSLQRLWARRRQSSVLMLILFLSGMKYAIYCKYDIPGCMKSKWHWRKSCFASRIFRFTYFAILVRKQYECIWHDFDNLVKRTLQKWPKKINCLESTWFAKPKFNHRRWKIRTCK